MESSIQQYKQAVSVIKEAILHSQYRVAKMVTGEELSLNFGIGAYVSNRSVVSWFTWIFGKKYS